MQYGPSKPPELHNTISGKLSRVRKTPALYLGKVNPEILDVFLCGLYMGLVHTDSNFYTSELKGKIMTERGWDSKNTITFGPMIDSGLSDEEVVQEMLTIEILCWEEVERMAKT